MRSGKPTVLAVFFGDDGAPVGYASGYVENVEPGGTRAFQITSSFAEIRLADIAETLYYAVDWGF